MMVALRAQELGAYDTEQQGLLLVEVGDDHNDYDDPFKQPSELTHSL